MNTFFISLRKRRAWLLAVACIALGGCDQAASRWPRHNLTLEVAIPPASGADVLAHVLAHELGQALETRIVVGENRFSSAGPAAATFIRNAQPNGYSLLVASTDAVAIAPLFDKALADAMDRKLCGLALLAETPHVLVVNAQSSLYTLDELMAQIRRQPGELSYGSLGTGTTTHALGALFAQKEKLEITHVPYRNSAVAMKDLLGGHVTMMFATLQLVLPALRGGKLRALVTSGARRSADIPDTPTFAELGLADLTSTFWYGLFAPCGLERDVDGRLTGAVREVLQHPQLAAVLAGERSGSPPLVGADFADFIRDERRRWTAVAGTAELDQGAAR